MVERTTGNDTAAALEPLADTIDLGGLAGSAPGDAQGGAAVEALVLGLDDLLPDDRGEVVLTTEDDLPVSIVTHEALTASGIVDGHVTAAGVDVHGLHFYSFQNGVTLYSFTDLLITDGHATLV